VCLKYTSKVGAQNGTHNRISTHFLAAGSRKFTAVYRNFLLRDFLMILETKRMYFFYDLTIKSVVGYAQNCTYNYPTFIKIYAMTIEGTEGGQITLAQGAAMTARHRAEKPNALKARLFGKECIEKLLNQDGGACKGIRMYFAMNEQNEQELVLVGVDAEGNDMLDIIMDMSLPCPKSCSSPNPLNS